MPASGCARRRRGLVLTRNNRVMHLLLPGPIPTGCEPSLHEYLTTPWTITAVRDVTDRAAVTDALRGAEAMIRRRMKLAADNLDRLDGGRPLLRVVYDGEAGV